MKKVVLGLAAALIAIAFVLGLQWYEQYKIASFVQEQGPSVAKQTMRKFGSTFGPTAGLELGDISAGLDSVTIEKPVLICDTGDIRRITADRAVLTAVEMQSDFSAVIRMDLDLYGVIVYNGVGESSMVTREMHINDLRLEDNDPYPDLLAQTVTYKALAKKLDTGKLESRDGTFDSLRISEINYLYITSSVMGGIHIEQTVDSRSTVADIDKISFKSLHQPLSGFKTPPKDLSKLKKLLNNCRIDDFVAERMRIRTPGHEALDSMTIGRTGLSAVYKDETMRYKIDCQDISFELHDKDAAETYDEFLAELGYKTQPLYHFCLGASLDLDGNTISLDEASLEADGLGKLSLTMEWSNINYGKLFDKTDSDEALSDALLNDLEITYQDKSLANAVKRYIAKQNGTSVLAINAQLLAVSMAGGIAFEDPIERKMATSMARFALNPGTLQFKIKPKQPMKFNRIDEEHGKDDFLKMIKNGEITVNYTPPAANAPEKK